MADEKEVSIKVEVTEAETAANGDTEKVKAEEKGEEIKLSGAAKKRYKWLVDHGHTPEEARVLAQKPLDELVNENSDSDSDTQAEGETKEKTGNIRAAIVPEDYPTKTLSAEQQKTLQEEVLNKIMEQKDDPTKPKFTSSYQRAGSVIFSCVGSSTIDWLKSILEELMHKIDQPLKVVEGEEVVKTELMIANFPHSADEENEKILGFIAAQNEDLNVGTWDIIKRIPQGGPQGKALQLVISVDATSIANLEKKDFKVSYKFSQVLLKKKVQVIAKKPNTGKGPASKRKNPPPKKPTANVDSKPTPKSPKFQNNRGRSRGSRRPSRGGPRSFSQRDRSPPRSRRDFSPPPYRGGSSMMDIDDLPFSESYFGGSAYSQSRSSPFSGGYLDDYSSGMQMKKGPRRDIGGNKRKRGRGAGYRGSSFQRRSNYGPY